LVEEGGVHLGDVLGGDRGVVGIGGMDALLGGVVGDRDA